MPYKVNPITGQLDYYAQSLTDGPSSGVVPEKYYDLTESVGTGNRFARNDHTHGSPPEPFRIGSLYMNVTGIDPNVELGYGTWILIGQGLVNLT